MSAYLIFFVVSLKLVSFWFIEQNKIKDESQSSIQKPEDMAIEVTPIENPVAADDSKSEAEKNEGKQTPSPSTSTPPIVNKPAKRRITPMAIDP